MYSKTLFGFVFASVLAGSAVFAQGPVAGAVALTGGGAKAGMVTMRVEDTDVETAKGAPFCATVTTEHTQAFVDGNRIHTTDSSSVSIAISLLRAFRAGPARRSGNAFETNHAATALWSLPSSRTTALRRGGAFVVVSV